MSFLWLARSALLAAWALVAWGALLVLLTLGDAAGEGLRPALARLLPSPATSPWGWLNALSAALALVVGLVAGGLWLWGRRRSTAAPGPESRRPGE
ncbi:MAG TPA: hypothetical protein VLF95_08215 [Vicinamibacteria bacterium]|nr:hypothetical protein [Vicinamibacteria bacterium]